MLTNDNLLANDQPTTCPYDGARTEQVEQQQGHSVERCLNCGRLFNVWEE